MNKELYSETTIYYREKEREREKYLLIGRLSLVGTTAVVDVMGQGYR
jgi:hypothetical protein